MERIEFRHGGREYDDKYPDGIPTTLEIEHAELGRLSSGLVMYPEGHARNTSGNLAGAASSTSSACWPAWASTTSTRSTGDSPAWPTKSAAEIADLYDFEITGC